MTDLKRFLHAGPTRNKGEVEVSMYDTVTGLTPGAFVTHEVDLVAAILAATNGESGYFDTVQSVVLTDTDAEFLNLVTNLTGGLVRFLVLGGPSDYSAYFNLVAKGILV